MIGFVGIITTYKGEMSVSKIPSRTFIIPAGTPVIGHFVDRHSVYKTQRVSRSAGGWFHHESAEGCGISR
jgi:hypothetical protein